MEKKISYTFVCPNCDDEIIAFADNGLVWCKCGCSGVDHTPYYTRLLGLACTGGAENIKPAITK